MIVIRPIYSEPIYGATQTRDQRIVRSKIYCIIRLDHHKRDDYTHAHAWVSVARLVAYTLPGPLGVNETTAGAEIGAGGEGALTTGAGGAGEGDTGAVARADDGVAVVARGGCANASP